MRKLHRLSIYVRSSQLSKNQISTSSARRGLLHRTSVPARHQLARHGSPSRRESVLLTLFHVLGDQAHLVNLGPFGDVNDLGHGTEREILVSPDEHDTFIAGLEDLLQPGA